METTELLKISNTDNKITEGNTKPKSFYLDELINSLDFSRFNLAIIFICVLTNVNDGYFTAYFKFNEPIFISRFKWQAFDYNSVLIGQNFFYGIGAILSVYARTSYWDVNSNSLIAIVEFLTSLMMLIYTDTVIYKINIVFYCFCQGYLSNLSTNYLLEISHTSMRGGLFILVCGCKFLGQAIFGLVTWSSYSKTIQINADPGTLISGLVVSSAMLAVSTMYLVDSPRVLFYNNDTILVINFLKDHINNEQEFDYDKQKKIHRELEEYKRSIHPFVDTQEIRGHLHEYPDLFCHPFRNITLKGLMFAFLCIILITNVSDSYLPLLKQHNKMDEYLYIKTNYEVMIYKFFIFSHFFILGLFCIYVQINFKVLSLISLTISLSLVILIIVIHNYFTLFALLFEAFSYLYFFLIYLHYSEHTTTRLRNSFTSLFYFTFSSAFITQFFLIKALTEKIVYLPLYVNIGLCLLLFILDLCLNTFSTHEKGLNQIELAIFEEKNN